MSYYILDNRKTVPVKDVMTWGRWFEKAERHVADETINGVRVSTVFLGIDHSFGDGGPPILFETMAFLGESEDSDRCSTWEEAEAMHARMCEKVRQTASAKNTPPRAESA